MKMTVKNGRINNMRNDKKRAILTVLLGMFIVFTLAYTTSISAIKYDHVCQDTFLHRTYSANISTDGVIEELELTRDPINCTYGCTNLTFPATCRTSIETDAFLGPFMPMPIFILFEIIAFVLFIIGSVFRSPDNESYIVMPVASMILFFMLAISSISIDGVYNQTMMLLNMGFGMLSMAYVLYLYFVGSFKQAIKASNEERL